MSALGDLQNANKAKAADAVATAASVIAQEAIGADLQAVAIPIQWALAIQQTPGSGLTQQQAEDLAATYGWELYVKT